MVGSTMSGFGTNSSDVDMCLVPADMCLAPADLSQAPTDEAKPPSRTPGEIKDEAINILRKIYESFVSLKQDKGGHSLRSVPIPCRSCCFIFSFFQNTT